MRLLMASKSLRARDVMGTGLLSLRLSLTMSMIKRAGLSEEKVLISRLLNLDRPQAWSLRNSFSL